MPQSRVGRYERWIALALFLATCGLFSRAFFNQLLTWDDIENFTGNHEFRGLGWRQLQWMWTTFHLGPYQPLSWMSLGFDYVLWGTDSAGELIPNGYFLTNILLHALNVGLMYKLARRLLALSAGAKLGIPGRATAETWPLVGSAVLAAIIFGWHPLRVESVAWATERRDVLSTAFLLGAILKYLNAAEEQAAGSQSASRREFWWCTGLYAASLLSKSIGMTLPVVLLLLDWYPLGRVPENLRDWFRSAAFWRVCREKIPLAVLSALCMGLALYGQHTTSAMRGLDEHSLTGRIAQSFYGLAWYVVKTAWPTNLSPLYQMQLPLNPWELRFVGSAACVLLTTLLLWLGRKRIPAVWIAWSAYAILISPMLGLVQSGPQLTADRFSYQACIPWAWLVAGGAWCLLSGPHTGPASFGRIRSAAVFGTERRRMLYVLAGGGVAVSLLLAGQTWKQLGVWHDDHALWNHTLALEEKNSIAHNNLSITLTVEGDLQEALRHVNRALELNDKYVSAYLNRAIVYSKQGRHREAIDDLRHACQLSPHWAQPQYNLAVVLTYSGDEASAAVALQAADRLDPSHAEEYRRGVALARKYREEKSSRSP